MRRATEAELRRWREGRRAADADDRLVGSANQWADEKRNRSQVGYDADEEAERWWREVGQKTVGGSGRDASGGGGVSVRALLAAL